MATVAAKNGDMFGLLTGTNLKRSGLDFSLDVLHEVISFRTSVSFLVRLLGNWRHCGHLRMIVCSQMSRRHPISDSVAVTYFSRGVEISRDCLFASLTASLMRSGVGEDAPPAGEPDGALWSRVGLGSTECRGFVITVFRIRRTPSPSSQPNLFV